MGSFVKGHGHFDLVVSVVLVNSVQRIQLGHTNHSVDDIQNLSQRKVESPQGVRVDSGHHCAGHILGFFFFYHG